MSIRKAPQQGTGLAYCAVQNKMVCHTFIENASEMVTAKGRPSGTATTNMVTPKMKKVSGPSANFEIGKPLFWMSHLVQHAGG